MRAYRTVTLDPTGNITCLVTESVPEAERPALTEELLKRCEQAGYLEDASEPFVRARLTMMGGEFCGNAAMGTAAYLAELDGLRPGGEALIPLRVSGAADIVECRIRALENGYRGTVRMPRVFSIQEEKTDGHVLTAVRMEGITHLILRGGLPGRTEAEALLRRRAETGEEDALGLLQWDAERRFMTPLVWVRRTATMVWETGCGSGTAAIGAAEALRNGEGVTVTAVNQPGGRAEAEATVRNGQVTEILLTGTVRILK